MRSSLAFVLLCVTPGVGIAEPFDGVWAVKVTPTSGECETVNWPIQISAGKVIAIAGLPGSAAGGISPMGKVDITMTSGSDTLVARGAAKGALASGKWLSASRSCAGKWSALRGG